MKFIYKNDSTRMYGGMSKGDVVNVTPMQIVMMKKTDGDHRVYFVSREDIAMDFLQYDEIEHIDAINAIECIMMRYRQEDDENEMDLIEKIEDYINKRKRILCETEDIQKVQYSTKAHRIIRNTMNR